MYLAIALLVPSKSVTSYSERLLSPDPVLTVTAVPAMFARTSGSTIMFVIAPVSYTHLTLPTKLEV